MRTCCSWLGPSWALLLLIGLFSETVLQSLGQSSAAHVIYFKDVNTQSPPSAGNGTLGKGMLFESRRVGCRNGFMRDHRHRCRRIV